MQSAMHSKTKYKQDSKDSPTAPSDRLREIIRSLEISLKPQSPQKLHENIASFSVTADSVVATATIVTSGVMRRIVVEWGDGNSSRLNARPGQEVHIGQIDPLPTGTYRFHHTYGVFEDRKAFSRNVNIKVEDTTGVSFISTPVTVTPRYKITNYRTTVPLADNCDTLAEETSEFDIHQYIDGNDVNYWRWEPLQSIVPSATFRLENSQFSREMIEADPHFYSIITFSEDDPVSDDKLASLRQDMHPTLETETIETTLTEDDSDPLSGVSLGGSCKVTARYDREVKLVVPLPQNTVTFEATTG